jgi:hypothetical protein
MVKDFTWRHGSEDNELGGYNNAAAEYYHGPFLCPAALYRIWITWREAFGSTRIMMTTTMAAAVTKLIYLISAC